MTKNKEEKEQKLEDIKKQYDALLKSLDKKSQEIIQELMPLWSAINDARIQDIYCGLNELKKKGCHKGVINFTGKTLEGKTIKAKEKITIKFINISL